jgi:hypothetical protein
MPRRWALILSVINVVVYGVLVATSRPPKIEGLFGNADVGFYAPLSERIAVALDAPALFPAMLIARLVGTQEKWFVWSVGVAPMIVLWYFIGLWLDRFHLPARSNSVLAWREPSRLIAAVVLCSALLFVGLTWQRAFAGADWGLGIVAGMVIWPVVIGVIAIRTIWRGVY